MNPATRKTACLRCGFVREINMARLHALNLCYDCKCVLSVEEQEAWR